MVKTVKEAVKEVVEGKKQSIDLLRNPDWDFDAEKEVKVVMSHEDIAGYSVNSDFVAVMTKDGTTHIYMIRDIEYIKHYNV